MQTATTGILLVLGLCALAGIAAIVIGLLIFFKGRAHVRKKFGNE